MSMALRTEDFDRSDALSFRSRWWSNTPSALPEPDKAQSGIDGESGSRFSNTLLDSLEAFLTSRLKQVGEVLTVRLTGRVEHSRRVIHVWTTLSKDDRATRYRVYEIEESLMARFTDELFDFHLHLEGKNLPGGDVPIYPAGDAEQG